MNHDGSPSISGGITPASISDGAYGGAVDDEKSIHGHAEVAVVQDGGQDERLHRQLRARHASMLALGGAIGTGLIIGSGTGLARAGPVGLLIAFMYVGTLCYGMMVALGEMAAFLPHQRGFPGHATRFVGAGFGGMTGFSYYCKYLIGTPTQYSACAIIVNYWIPSTKVNNGVWVAIFIVVTGAMQFMPVRVFGEYEFWASTFKVVVLTGLMLVSLVIDLGGGPTHDRWGFRTWRDLPFAEYLEKGAEGRFLGFVSALTTAVYSYTSSEMVGIALGEMSNPRKNVARAVRACFYRVVFLYCGSIFFVGLVVPADSHLLLAANSKSTNANASPFVVAINVAGIKVLPHIINAAALIFVWSAANSDVYVNSRTLYSLAMDGNAPRVFLRTNAHGVPYLAVGVSVAFSCLAFTTVHSSAYNVFKKMVSAVTLFSTIAWASIFWSHIRFMKACKVQGKPRQDLPYFNRLNPYLSWWGLAGTAVISLTKGFDSIVHEFNAVNFVVNYVALPVSVLGYLFYSFRSGVWFLRSEDVDLQTGVRQWDEIEQMQEAEEAAAEGEEQMGQANWLRRAKLALKRMWVA